MIQDTRTLADGTITELEHNRMDRECIRNARGWIWNGSGKGK